MVDAPATLRDLLLARADDDAPALLAGDRRWSWREYVATAAARAAALADLLDPARPPHVGVLLDNTPEMAFQLAAAGLGAHVVVGLNTTRRGAGLLADIRKADAQVVVVEPAHAGLLDGLDLAGVRVVDAAWFRQARPPVVEPAETTGPPLPHAEPTPDSLFMLIFTSGTSGEPKAVRITDEKVSHPGRYLTERLGLTRDDVHYVAMPLFHSNAVMAGWAPALVTGATIALAERFSASGFLPDVRRYAATYANYVGKPLAYVLATPEQPDDADNPLRIVFGNEAGERDTIEFARRFGCVVIDGFGSTENAVVVSRVEGTPPGSLGQPFPGVAVLDPETGAECPRAEIDAQGRVTNLDDCVGELVNTQGTGQFAGYYNDEAATAERMRGGMYWSGDLAYRDAEGWVYYAGRTADWLRVDGENLAAAPIERILLRHPSVSEAAVYAVPDPHAGDQLVAALVTTGTITPEEWEAFLAAQADLGTKAWPRFVRILDALPRTATNKVLKRELQATGIDAGPDTTTWEREERGTAYGHLQASAP
ncbi:AMP-binding protein [Nocardioides pocheonensis]|uniref:Acyl-CoA synthetase n=1 Tax=Nocardioides pocheonensis TaxID=661485 RepID=A0A3N0GP16_9ACTN|nr:AMP-binding protein [Nocardioides pocheonensis]RNM14214.1 acyl-CoA synthetase [Nocardioides pocheonensis]